MLPKYSNILLQRPQKEKNIGVASHWSNDGSLSKSYACGLPVT